MRKIVAFTVLLMVAVSAYLGAESRFYESSFYGYSGEGTAAFLYNVLEELPDFPVNRIGYIEKNHTKELFSLIKERWTAAGCEIIPRLSKETRWLIEQSIEEWDTEVGDLFAVFVKPSDWDSKRGLFIGVNIVVLDDYNSFEYAAFVVKETADD